MPGVYFKNFPVDKLTANVLQREPLRPDERIKACWDGATFGPLTNGMLLTDQSLIEWTKKKVRRFDFAKMIEITYEDPEPLFGTVKFKYNDETVKLTMPEADGFFRAVVQALPKESIIAGSNIATCAVCGVQMEGVLLSIKSYFSGEVKFSEEDIEKFVATNLAHECSNPGCSAFICAKCESTLKVEERTRTVLFIKKAQKGRVCPSCDGWFGLSETTFPRLLVAGRFPTEVYTIKKSSGVGTVTMEFVYHQMGTIRGTTRWQVPTHVCCLCMHSPVYHVHSGQLSTTLGTLVGDTKVVRVEQKWPLCKGCYALVTDNRLVVSPPYKFEYGAALSYINADEKLKLSFANPDYGDLFMRVNHAIVTPGN